MPVAAVDRVPQHFGGGDNLGVYKSGLQGLKAGYSSRRRKDVGAGDFEELAQGLAEARPAELRPPPAAPRASP